MKHLDGLLELIENEIKSVESNGKFRSREEIDSVYKLVDIAKDVYCIWAYEDDMDGESEAYAYDGSYADRSYRGNSLDSGRSYARGRGRNAKRDSMGRYSRDGMAYDGGYSNRRYSRNYSRADAKEEYMQEMREMMENAPDEQTRQSIQRMIQQMEQG